MAEATTRLPGVILPGAGERPSQLWLGQPRLLLKCRYLGLSSRLVLLRATPSKSQILQADQGDGGASGGGDHGSGNGKSGGGGGGDGDGEGGSDEQEFGRMLTGEDIDRRLKARGAPPLPGDLAEAAASVGIRELILERYLDLQAAVWPLGPAIRNFPMLRNRMLADPSFLFKVFTEIAIDSGCATFAEVKKRGKNFWNEFELYMSDLLVGVVMDIALVGMLAPFVQFGGKSSGSSRAFKALGALPSSMFEAERPGRRFSVEQRVGTFFYKGVQYGAIGFLCGLIGQGIANSLMHLRRSMKKPGTSDDDEVAVPPLFRTAALWGVFMGLSSNTRYQVINGLERLVEASPVVKKVPLVGMAFTVGVRFANNTYGGMQYIDWARIAGVQPAEE